MSIIRDSRKNARISVKRREILIDLVEVKEMTVSKAARKISIKRSTARMIIKKYRETGKVFRKKMNSKESQEDTPEKMAKQQKTGNDSESNSDSEGTIQNMFQTPEDLLVAQNYFVPPIYYMWPYFPSF